MAQVKITVNGTEVTADDEKTILQVVRENDLDEIPTLCYEERLGQISSCFLCVVEVEGARGLVPSCSQEKDGVQYIISACAGASPYKLPEDG